MHVAEFSCPFCAIPLRVRDRGFVGRTISCPDCGERVRIVQNDTGQIEGHPADAPPAKPQERIASVWTNPTAIGWVVAGCLTMGLVWFVLQTPAPRGDGAISAAANTPVDELAPVGDDPPPARDIEADDNNPAKQLAAIQDLLHPATAKANQFPAGTVAHETLIPTERLSWIAALIAATDPDIPPTWDRPWNDPANSRFVRRQQPDWLNPKIDRVVSGDRYPATHFVGVAGVGDDAAVLPADHPRAGIFGHDRQVQLDEIGDGLANTMLIAGVEDQLGSWAAGGEPTVRGFTAEPYIGGPDGFGTGEGDSMQVLMADGSVRSVSRETDPRVIRRMAAINDSLPLDPSTPGEPGGQSEKPPEGVAGADPPAEPDPADSGNAERPPDVAAVIADIAGAQDVPIDVLLAEPPVEYDVDTALQQKIAEFRQTEPVPLRSLLRLVEEMAAVPIHFDDLPPASVPLLDKPVTVSLRETHVGEILQAVLDAAKLSFDARPAGIFVTSPASTVEAD